MSSNSSASKETKSISDSSTEILSQVQNQNCNFLAENTVSTDITILMRNVNNPEIMKHYFELCERIQINKNNNERQMAMLNRKAELDEKAHKRKLELIREKNNVGISKHNKKTVTKNKTGNTTKTYI